MNNNSMANLMNQLFQPGDEVVLAFGGFEHPATINGVSVDDRIAYSVNINTTDSQGNKIETTLRGVDTSLVKAA